MVRAGNDVAGFASELLMSTLILSTWALPAARTLADAARSRGWHACADTDAPEVPPTGRVVLYSGTDRVLALASRYQVTLIDPPFDLLARLPFDFRLRAVEFARFADLARLKSPTFVKPADAVHKSFDAGVYSSVRDIRTPRPVDADAPVLLAEPVAWSAEFRCFVREREVVAWSPYVSFGKPVWKPFGPGTLAAAPPSQVTAFCQRLFARPEVPLPPAFVLDVGLIDERGWAAVEFNPVWCSGVLGADPRGVLVALERACY